MSDKFYPMPFAPIDVRHFLGAKEHGSRLLGQTDEYVLDEPSTNEYGWYQYKDVMSCQMCPMCILHRSGVCHATCGIDSHITALGAPCDRGILRDGSGLTQNDLEWRDQMLAADRSSYSNPNAYRLPPGIPRFESLYQVTPEELAVRHLVHPSRIDEFKRVFADRIARIPAYLSL